MHREALSLCEGKSLDFYLSVNYCHKYNNNKQYSVRAYTGGEIVDAGNGNHYRFTTEHVFAIL